MSLCDMNSLLVAARQDGYAVGAFTVWDMESVQAVIGAAESVQAPVIAQVGPWEADFAGMELLAEIVKHVALRASVPVAFHLDHGESFERAMQAIHCGFTSVMIDASNLPFEENVAVTREVAKCAHAAGVSVEGEIGIVGGGIHSAESGGELAMTDPEEAARFAAETGVDALAVAIGNAHGFYKAPPKLDFARLSRVAERVSIPLVLHGGTGIPDDAIREAIKHGVAKINVCTEFVAAFGRAFQEVQSQPDFAYNVPSLFSEPRRRAMELIGEKIKLFSGKR
ncbi:MAG: class II fructose-bisphosphate aldolase [bacterium]|nr:class II fructose-bisphosphate aldolase [bacterium]